MKAWSHYLLLASAVCLVLFLSATPVLAQSEKCCGTCGGDAKVCPVTGKTGSHDHSDHAHGACPVTGNAGACPASTEECCGTCGGDKACSGEPKACGGDPMAAMANCVICKAVFEDMELIMNCDYSISNFSEGTIYALNVKKPAMMDRFKKVHERDRAMAAKFKKLDAATCNSHLCQGCAGYFDLIREGMKEEVIQTPTGCMTLLKTDNPALLKKAHAYGTEMNAMLASFDMSAMTGGETCDASSACSASSSCSTQSACSASACETAEPCIDMAACMQEFATCPICSDMMKRPDMMNAAKCEILFSDRGMAMMSNVVDKAMLNDYQAFEKIFQDKINQVRNGTFKGDMDKFCSVCKEFGKLEDMGASIEWVPTASGSMTLLTSYSTDVINKIHKLGKTFQAMNASWEKMGEAQ